MKPNSRLSRIVSAFCLAAGFAIAAHGQNLTLRIVTYNIEDDISNSIFHISSAYQPLPGLIYPYAGGSTTNGGVLEGIGEETLSDGVAQPPDIIALEETSGSSTINPIVAGLNAYYSVNNPLASTMYAATPYQATESGGTTNDGNGPNSLVYNTKTVQLLASVPVDPAGGASKLGLSSGEYREVVRYEFSPAGQTPTTATEFYIYVSHYKSGTTSADLVDRSAEAYIIRTNEQYSLPVSARVIYVGDYNVSTSTEASYQTIVTAAPTNGVTQGQGVDPFNTSGATGIDWTANSLLSYKSESDTDLHYRDDFQCCTTNIYSGAAGGLVLVQGTYHVFGNNGTTSYESSVNNGANTSLNSDLVPSPRITASQLYLDLTGASDHLPVVADYTIPVNQPVAAFASAPANSGAVPLAVTFTDSSTGIVTNWFWNFGDGATSNTFTTTAVSHTYTNVGTYSVTETVSGPGGVNSVTQTNLVTVLGSYQNWQLQYFGCTGCAQSQTNADADGTGQNNLFKYVAGLNPTNPASVFTFNITAVTNPPGEIKLTFSPNILSRTYTAYSTTSLTNPAWTPIVTSPNTRMTNGSSVTITDTGASSTQKYYEIQISGPSL